MSALPESIEAVAAIIPVDAPARERFAAFADLVRKWQPVKNLVAPSTLPHLWVRHMADGAQAYAALPSALRWLDIGSGAGFPGLVTAILLADRPGAAVTLVESNGRKAAFLMTVARELALPATVLSVRIESLAERYGERLGPVDAVSARALARLDKLFALSEPWLSTGSRAVFHKGQDFGSEIAEATQSWAFDLVELKSKTDHDACVAVFDRVRRLGSVS